jgi:hypothetical protein
MRKLKREHKNLYILEAGYIYCKRNGIEYSDDSFIDNIFLKEDFDHDGEFDDMCSDLRCYRHYKNYTLKNITEEEYEMCIDEFGGIEIYL